jgi:hypothetical protein
VLDVAFHDRALAVPDASAVVVADLHVGRAEASEVQFPLGERSDLVDRLTAVVDQFSPETVVIAGDVLHEFGHASGRSVETLADLAAACRAGGARLVLVAGNHDGTLSTAWDGEVHDSYRLERETRGDVLVCHGHEEPATDDSAGPELYVVGHDHPAITIEGRKHPCFLYGEGAYRGADLVMLPAFSRVAAGVEVNGMRSRDFQSPLVSDVDSLRPIVWDESAAEALWFPPLGRFRRLL